MPPNAALHKGLWSLRQNRQASLGLCTYPRQNLRLHPSVICSSRGLNLGNSAASRRGTGRWRTGGAELRQTWSAGQDQMLTFVSSGWRAACVRKNRAACTSGERKREEEAMKNENKEETHKEDAPRVRFQEWLLAQGSPTWCPLTSFLTPTKCF